MKSFFLKLAVPFLLGLGILASFSREVILANFYGSTRNLEIYKIAFSIPYAFFQSLSTVLIGGLLPVLIAEGKECFYIIRTQIYKIFGFIAILALLTVNQQSSILAPGFKTEDLKILTLNLLICWIILIFSGLIFPLRLWLQDRDKKALIASTSLLFSFFYIVFIFFLHDRWLDFNLSLISVTSAFLIYTTFSLACKACGLPQNSQTVKKNPNFKKKLNVIILGAFIYVALLAIPRLIDRAIASKMNDGVIANLDYAMNFYVAFGVLIGTSFTIVSARKIASEHKRNKLTLRWIFQVVGTPFLVALILIMFLLPFSDAIVKIAYMRGAFTEQDALQVSKMLFWFLISLPVMVAGMLLSQILVANSMHLLIGVALYKILGKLTWLFLFFKVNDLSVFGKSTLAMEAIGSIVMLIFLFMIKKNWQ